MVGINFLNYMDRWVASSAATPIEKEFHLTDAQFGLIGPAAESYAHELLSLEVRGGRDEDIARKLHEDFASRGIAVSDHAIARKMEEVLVEAAEQVMRETKKS